MVCLSVAVFYDIQDNLFNEFCEGTIDNFTQFFFLFLAPIMIAYDHKHTHVITPAGTIMTATIVVTVVLDYILAEVLVLIL